MDLNKLKVEELSVQEIKDIEGGTPAHVAIAVGLSILYLANTCYNLSRGRKMNGMP